MEQQVYKCPYFLKFSTISGSQESHTTQHSAAMRKIVYYVTCSLDGSMSGPDGDISGFVGVASGLERYLTDLRSFGTVIMGRHTYEFGYRFGLQPGQAARSTDASL